MAKIKLSDTVCQNRLTKYVESKYNLEIQDDIEYFNDLNYVDTYAFKYHVPQTKDKMY